LIVGVAETFGWRDWGVSALVGNGSGVLVAAVRQAHSHAVECGAAQ